PKWRCSLRKLAAATHTRRTRMATTTASARETSKPEPIHLSDRLNGCQITSRPSTSAFKGECRRWTEERRRAAIPSGSGRRSSPAFRRTELPPRAACTSAAVTHSTSFVSSAPPGRCESSSSSGRLISGNRYERLTGPAQDETTQGRGARRDRKDPARAPGAIDRPVVGRCLGGGRSSDAPWIGG